MPIEYTRVSLNDLHDYLRRNGLRWVRTEDTGDAIFVDVEVRGEQANQDRTCPILP
jgi:hypothetical protein